MDSVDLQVIRTAREWVAGGRRVVLATVIRTWGSAPRPIGALSAIRDDGMVVGSVSGGCVEDDMIARVKAGTLAENTPTTTKYGVSAEEAQRFGLPCGGTLELVLEPLTAVSGLDDLLSRIERHELVLRRLDMKTGRATTGPAKWQDQLEFDGTTLTTVYGPRWRLLIIGASQLSVYLAQMAQALDYQVTVCDPRSEYTDLWAVPGADLQRGMPDDVVTAMNLDGHSAVVTLTHDPKLDDMALLEALKSPAFYIGAIGSKKNNDARRQRLAEFDLSQAEIARLHGPVGLKIGSKTPPEIAVAILAEMTAIRNGVDIKRFVEPPKATTAGCAVD
ncbi:MAG: XdhC family protein [Burkholderiales bacterium]|jgi:xanthine dehydrogenase accessory factor|nr:XdhC family protein [Burkholderiales bacterium]